MPPCTGLRQDHRHELSETRPHLRFGRHACVGDVSADGPVDAMSRDMCSAHSAATSAAVLVPDVTTCTSVVHVVDGVLLPANASSGSGSAAGTRTPDTDVLAAFRPRTQSGESGHRPSMTRRLAHKCMQCFCSRSSCGTCWWSA